MQNGTKQGMGTGSHESDTHSGTNGAQEARPSPGRTAGQPAGQTVSGPGFYVWEEDPRQARQWGAELADASRWQHRGHRS